MADPDDPAADDPTARGDASADARIALVARALGHPVRLKVLRLLLARGPLSGAEIVAAFDLAQSTLSEHLRLLKEAGLVVATPDPPRLSHAFAPAGLDPLAAFLLDLMEGPAPGAASS